MDTTKDTTGPFVIGGVDTHKDLHVAAVVDNHDRLLGSQSFATTRHGYKQMLAWMRSFGPLRRVGVEATGTYGACEICGNSIAKARLMARPAATLCVTCKQREERR